MALVGIARLASKSELLGEKRAVTYFEIPTRSILNRTKPGMPFRWTVNPYRGCEFACKYCYARYTHEYMEMEAEDFENRIYAKSAAAQLLRQELARIDRKDAIAIGTATDPYQPAERRFLRTREILEVFAREKGLHLGLITKSDLVARDIDLLVEISRANVLMVILTITTLDEKLARLLEPRAPHPALRLGAVSRLRAAGLAVGVVAKPVLPGLTDSERQLDRLARAARDAGALSFSGGALFLPPAAQKIFFPFLEKQYPRLAPRYRELFATGAYLRRSYQETVSERVHRARERYGLASGMIEYRPEIAVEEQGELFPLQ